jgi:hypothetical protein
MKGRRGGIEMSAVAWGVMAETEAELKGDIRH